MEGYEELHDWEALRKFRQLSTDAERMEQMFLTSLSSSRTSKANGEGLRQLNEKVAIQNGRIGKLEVRWVQGAAVIAFLLVVLPILLASAALVTR